MAKSRGTTGIAPWNKGLTKESDPRIEAQAVKLERDSCRYISIAENRFGKAEIWVRFPVTAPLLRHSDGGLHKYTDGGQERYALPLQGRLSWGSTSTVHQ